MKLLVQQKWRVPFRKLLLVHCANAKGTVSVASKSPTNPQGPIIFMYYFGPRITTKHEQPSCPRKVYNHSG